jgi:hypothetical protein
VSTTTTTTPVTYNLGPVTITISFRALPVRRWIMGRSYLDGNWAQYESKTRIYFYGPSADGAKQYREVWAQHVAGSTVQLADGTSFTFPSSPGVWNRKAGCSCSCSPGFVDANQAIPSTVCFGPVFKQPFDVLVSYS